MRTKKTDSNQPWRRSGGVTFAFGNDLVKRRRRRRDPNDYSRLAVAIRLQWPDSDLEYRDLIFRRWRELYQDLPLDDAVTAVRAGFSSPSAAMRSGIIKRRNYTGFTGDRS